MTVNGYKISWSMVVSALIFTFWLGGLSLSVQSLAQNQDKHEAEPAHAEAALATNTVQADVRHNKQEIADIKRQLEKMEGKMERDKDEILDAIRESDSE
jgi:hypothetical protein